MNLSPSLAAKCDPGCRIDERPIGGFFELELPAAGNAVHPDAIALSTGRSCLLAILKFLRPKRCFVPSYICDAALQPFRQLNIAMQRYPLDASFQPLEVPPLAADDCFLLTNYFGLQRTLGEQLSQTYQTRLIIDDTHDFFSGYRYPQSWSFTSARKFCGVPDGAFLFPPGGIDHELLVPRGVPAFADVSVEHAVDRLQGRQTQAFAKFQAYEQRLPCELSRISELSRTLLSTLDLPALKARRERNFQFLAKQLAGSNTIPVAAETDLAPIAYPYFPCLPIAHRSFHKRQIFVPRFWPDTYSEASALDPRAIQWANHLLPLPIDHRYIQSDMQRIVDATQELRATS